MKVDDIVSFRGPNLLPSASDEAELAFLRPILKKAGYTEAGIGEQLGSFPPIFHEIPGYLWTTSKDTSYRAALIRLFILADTLDRATVDKMFGAEHVEALLARDVLKHKDNLIASNVDVHPCENHWVFTDHRVTLMHFPKKVYELGADSYTTIRMTPRRKVRSTLDLCTGSGVHAILATAHTEQTVIGVDISERAQGFAQVNAALNGVSKRTKFLQGDLYNALEPGQRFQLIVANPPWIASPDQSLQLYRWGGEDGETITRRIVEGLPGRLEIGGTLAMFVVYPERKDSKYLERITSWLGQREGWGIGLVDLEPLSLGTFIHVNMEAKFNWALQVQEFGRWLELFERQGIERMWTGMVYVRRLERRDVPNWTAHKRIGLPALSLGAQVSAWLDAQTRFSDPDWDPDDTWVPRPADGIRHIYADTRNGRGRVEFGRAEWMGSIELDADETAVLAYLAGGKRTLAQLNKWWTTQKEFSLEAGRSRLRNMLRTLGRNEVIV